MLLRRLIAVVVFIAIAAAAHAEQRGAVDWIFLIDTSASMRGAGGTPNIFPDVKASLGSFIQEASDGDSITVITFDKGAASQGTRDIHSQLDRDELVETVNALEANGNRTHLGLAIQKGLERSEALLKRGDATRERAIVLFTDGKEDVRGIKDPVRIAANLDRVEVSKPWLFFVSMGEHEAQLDAFRERTQILKLHDSEAIRNAAATIRKVVLPPPKPQIVRLLPQLVDFGSVESGKTTEWRLLTIEAEPPTAVNVTLAETPGITMAPRLVDAPARIRVRLDVAKDAPAGAQSLTFLAGKASTRGALTVVTPPLWRSVAKWSALALILLAVAVIAYLLYSGKTPGELFGGLRDRNALEGELEIVAPRTSDAFIGLPSVNASEIALSQIVPLDALAGSDARLYCRRHKGEKQMWIEASGGGSLRVNEIELPATELYDADTIEIGKAKLRFNRVGHERPSLTEELS